MHSVQAILSVLLNRPEIQIGPDLASLKEFTADFSPEMRGASCCQMHAIEMRSHHCDCGYDLPQWTCLKYARDICGLAITCHLCLSGSGRTRYWQL